MTGFYNSETNRRLLADNWLPMKRRSSSILSISTWGESLPGPRVATNPEEPWARGQYWTGWLHLQVPATRRPPGVPTGLPSGYGIPGMSWNLKTLYSVL